MQNSAETLLLFKIVARDDKKYYCHALQIGWEKNWHLVVGEGVSPENSNTNCSKSNIGKSRSNT